LIAASAALSLSDIPFPEIVGAARVGRVNGEYVIFPTHEQIDNGDLDRVVAGTEIAVIMVEGGAKEAKEEHALEAIKLGLEAAGRVASLVRELKEKCGKEKRKIELVQVEDELRRAVKEFAEGKIEEVLAIPDKDMREAFMETLLSRTSEHLGEEDKSRILDIRTVLEEMEKDLVRGQILTSRKRADGRSPEEIRPVSCEVGVLPRTHGSALFTRGETQSLSVATLGTADDEQRLDELRGESSKSFMLHYNFPPFSVGEIKPIRGPGRR